MPQPNVILVLTDDQGYGDLGCTGNPWIHTPHIDQFYEEAVRCPDFHVQPLCTPTRGALMTGRYPVRNGAWATTWGRAILHRDETTIADVFSKNGYATGLFGKWHLGDNYPYRPFERGFQRVVAHQGGGVGQTSDFWGNNYFDDTYFANGQARAYEGYCTDVWFEQARDFIEENREQPFFAVIATNAPHCPYLVADRYREPYENQPDITEPAFYGMITNIDENFGALDAYLKKSGLAENTILIFMTDNGTSGGAQVMPRYDFVTKGYNAGMRGVKGSYYDGGHRVPFFIRWPKGGLSGGVDRAALCCDVDLLPTFVELCGLKHTPNKKLDGHSVASVLKGETAEPVDHPHFLQYRQATCIPEKWHAGVMTSEWRLVWGSELYHIKTDPEQRNDVASEHPEIVAQLREAYETWWAEVEPGLEEYTPIPIGNPAENPTKLTSMDVMGDVAWNQKSICEARLSSGNWRVTIEKPGRYQFSLRRWPEELPIPIEGMVSSEFAKNCVYPGANRVAIHPTSARLHIGDITMRQPVEQDSEAVVFECAIETVGDMTLEAWFIDEDGSERGAYYVIAKYC